MLKTRGQKSPAYRRTLCAHCLVHFQDGKGRYRDNPNRKAAEKRKIPRPVAAAAEELECYDRYLTTEESIYKWSMGSVREILRNPVYKGAVRGQKRPKISLKSEKESQCSRREHSL